MIATSTTTPASDQPFYKAVCYRCRYVGMEAAISRCPLCEFPIILEPGDVPEAEEQPDVADIFHRTSVAAGAPPLPGVDGRPRKAQLLAEARRRRHRSAPRPDSAADRPGDGAPARPAIARAPSEGSGTTAVGRRPSVLMVSLVVAAAGAVGFLAACINVGI